MNSFGKHLELLHTHFLWVILLISGSANAGSLSTLDIQNAPNKGDWQRMRSMSEPELTKLWEFHHAQGKHLSNWAWQWRMGWLQTCNTPSHPKRCLEIFSEGVRDPAMVVRAEAATQIGGLYENSKNVQAVEWLKTAWRNPNNIRGGKPLFVCERILQSLRRIGGKDAHTIATKFASEYPETKVYLRKLAQSEKKAAQKNSTL